MDIAASVTRQQMCLLAWQYNGGGVDSANPAGGGCGDVKWFSHR
jgi:hypothetical protein